jgi:hypothetical protein
MRVRTAIVVVAALMLAVAGGSGLVDGGGGPPLLGARPAAAAELAPFGACDELLAHVRTEAAAQVGPWGLDGGPWGGIAVDTDDSAGAMAARAEASVAQDAGGSGGGDGTSGTNVAVAGVDKSDGATLFVAGGGAVRIVDVRGPEPTVLGALDLDEAWDAQLLLDADRLLVLSGGYRETALHGADGAVHDMVVGQPVTTLRLVDVAAPGAPRLLETLTLDGHLLSARMVEGRARVVVRSDPAPLPFTGPTAPGTEDAATARNREVVADAPLAAWLPQAELTGPDGATQGPAVACDAVHHPDEPSGLSTLTVLGIDLAGGLADRTATAVLGAGETIAASADRLYVATTRWDAAGMTGDAARSMPMPVGGADTEIHAFDTTGPAARYVGSGTVPGTILSTFSMSEHEGFLRVASTEGGGWGGPTPSESRVTVLAERDGGLVEVGAVGGLGVDEQIHGVRFLGDVGYVVTFRQIDPLYTIDLSEPTAPRVRGELKIPGFSAYLHPLDGGRLLGVGPDATDEGRSLGVQLSLFDVADLDDPQRVATLPLGWEPPAADGTGWSPASSPVEHDHRAFLAWDDLVLVPVAQWRWDEASQTEEARSALAVARVGAGTIAEVGRVSHLDRGDGGADAVWRALIGRALVVRGRLVTVSKLGVLTSDLGTLAPLGWAPFGS